MKALVDAFNQEKALVGAFSVIVKPMCRLTALTQAQLMSAVISKRLNFSPPASSSKYPSILPKPSPPTTNLYTTNQEPQISPAYQMKGEPEQKIFYRNI